MIKWLTFDAVVTTQPVGDRFRVRENFLRVWYQTIVRLTDPIAHLCPVRVSREIVERRVPKIIGRSVLVHDPQHLALMRHQISRKFHADDESNRFAIRFAQVKHAPGECAAHDFRGWIPLEWQGYDFNVVSRLN